MCAHMHEVVNEEQEQTASFYQEGTTVGSWG